VREHGVDARHRERLETSISSDPRVRVRASDGVPPEHPGRVQVARVRELAATLGTASARRVRGVAAADSSVLVALIAGGRVHGVEDLRVARAAAEVPGERLADLVVVGSGTRLRRSAAATTKPGVQKPHWTAPVSANAS
jgi:hypothetical protein